MATILFAAAGAAVGAGFGGTVLGLSGAVIGRAFGATLGRVIDQKVLGGGSDAVEVGRIERFRLLGASEGSAVPQIWGRVRVAGQVIWASRFQENVATSGGGKGGTRPSTKEFTYTVSLAVALCEGQITRVGRVWADGNEIEPDSLNMRVYSGSNTQLPDPKIEAVEGAGNAPSYRGTAYVVIEALDITAYGNRVPQFSFEIIRSAQGTAAAKFPGLSKTIPGVCMIPGTGEYALATTPVHYELGPGVNRSANVNSHSGKADFTTSLEQMTEELPAAQGVSLVVSWFGDDLRCASCQIQPKVEQKLNDGVPMAWAVSGLDRTAAAEVPKVSGSPVYGGSPADQSVVEAILALKAANKKVTFYPFILMEQMSGNTLSDPYSGGVGQPALPWRGRITLNLAPGQIGSTDTTAAAAAEVASFFGTAQPGDFTVAGQAVVYSGPSEWRYRRFILHYAYLCAAAGGVDAFCIGSELRGLTQIRGAANSFPTVVQLRQLAAEVKAILGATTKISYAADWSEYFGYHVDNNVFFHLDPLWSDPAIDFIGIDNYMPVSDWRDGDQHADAAWGDIYNVDYIRSNIAGGEGFDWYYANPAGADAQLRLPITDGAYGEAWIYRPKDLRSWWSSSHHNRVGGVRSAVPTGWIAGSKPIRFTEFGCAAIDKGTNQPNLFLDPKSSESSLPRASTGRRDDLLQLTFFQAMSDFWTDPDNNPQALLYPGRMLDFDNSLAWAWDARPFPVFPANNGLWTDGPNYDKGHWLNGRSGNQHLSAVLAEICEGAGVDALDLSKARGIVRGYSIADINTARSALQPLLLAYPTDVVEREGKLGFQARPGQRQHILDPGAFAKSADISGPIERTRAADVEMPTHIRIAYTEAETDFVPTTAAAVFPDADSNVVSQSDIPLVLTPVEATTIAERWLAEARISRDSARFALPRSKYDVGVGDRISIAGESYRIDRLECSEMQVLEAVRIEPKVYTPADVQLQPRGYSAYQPVLPVFPLMLDLPLLKGSEDDHAPHVAAAAKPWPGTVGVWSSASDDSYTVNKLLTKPATMGLTQTPLLASEPGRWDRGPALRVRIETGTLSSVSELAVLSGANVAAIGDGSPANWEVFQFATATLVAPRTYELSMRLRGQAGTDGIMPTQWPVGSQFVLINSALQQIDLPLAARGLERYYRFGLAEKGYEAANTVLRKAAFDGVGLRPYAVAHLLATRLTSLDLAVQWVRRTRIDGDNWQSLEVPLGEDSELYRVQVTKAAALLHEITTSQPGWTYTAAQQAADGATGAVEISVAQISQRYGAGPERKLTVTL